MNNHTYIKDYILWIPLASTPWISLPQMKNLKGGICLQLSVRKHNILTDFKFGGRKPYDICTKSTGPCHATFDMKVCPSQGVNAPLLCA
jgi:hypothetical protein